MVRAEGGRGGREGGKGGREGVPVKEGRVKGRVDNNNNNESIYYAPCIRVIKPAQRRFTSVHSIPE